MRRVSANKLNGVDAEWLDPKQVKELCPIINISDNIRYPVLGATFQPRAGIAKHDHVAWAFARKADELGVDLIQNCEVTGFVKDGNRVVGRRDQPRPDRHREGGPVARPGTSSVLAKLAGFELPIQSHPLQALVSELHEPVHPTVVMSNHVHVYVSQAHKGELVMGAGIDSYNGYGQRGGVPRDRAPDGRRGRAVPDLRPGPRAAHLGRHRRRHPRRLADHRRAPRSRTCSSTAAGGPAASRRTPAAGWTFAHTIATGDAAPLNAPFALDRFDTGALIDEHGAAAVAH